ncbi:hypothetical protein C8R47DRAFT_1218150 [Mycena vitilis]|nr:hypothetical protein C8R47DRAFT_1218150 [Mycena vitilis]
MARLTLSLTLALALCFFLLLLASPGVSAVELKPKRAHSDVGAEIKKVAVPSAPKWRQGR